MHRKDKCGRRSRLLVKPKVLTMHCKDKCGWLSLSLAKSKVLTMHRKDKCGRQSLSLAKPKVLTMHRKDKCGRQSLSLAKPKVLNIFKGLRWFRGRSSKVFGDKVPQKEEIFINNENKYDDIINLPHHVSKFHPRMPLIDRAAQFSPFAALSGYNEAIKEAARLTHKKIELCEDEKENISLKLNIIQQNIKECLDVTITYFIPDKRKDGGSYRTIDGFIKNINKCAVYMNSGEKIPIENIYNIDGDFSKFDKI